MKQIRLTQGYVATVDDEDHEVLMRYRWKVLKAKGGKVYASRTVGRTGRTELMHRVVAVALPGEVVDHKDNNGLNNTRKNLRRCSQTRNLANQQKTRGRSRFKGVYFNKARGKWQAQIGAGLNASGKQVVLYLGRFATEVEAAKAYDAKAVDLHGEFAVLNLPLKPDDWTAPDVVKLIRLQCDAA